MQEKYYTNEWMEMSRYTEVVYYRFRSHKAQYTPPTPTRRNCFYLRWFLSVSHFTDSLFNGFPFYRFPIYRYPIYRFRYYRLPTKQFRCVGVGGVYWA